MTSSLSTAQSINNDIVCNVGEQMTIHEKMEQKDLTSVLDKIKHKLNKLHVSAVRCVPTNQQKNTIGALLYPLIHKITGRRSRRITDMFLGGLISTAHPLLDELGSPSRFKRCVQVLDSATNQIVLAENHFLDVLAAKPVAAQPTANGKYVRVRVRNTRQNKWEYTYTWYFSY
jgi:hypothetical protein